MKIAFLGDIALFGCFNLNQNNKLKQNLREISKYLSGFDLVVGNLESPFSIKKKTCGAKSAYLCSDIENAEILKWLHIDVVTLANNHTFDYGEEGYKTTIAKLDEMGIGHFGTEGQSWQYEKDGNRLLFTGYCCYSTNPLRLSENQGGYGINKYNVADIKASMKRACDKGYLNIVAAHVGLEHVNYPSLDHVRAARQLAEVCPFFYYGHHPHVIQGVEEYKGSIIAHSLGNFCFDDTYTDTSGDKPLIELTDQNRTGLIIELTVDGNKIVEWKEQMIHIERDGRIRLIEDDGRLAEYNDGLVRCEENAVEYSLSRKAVLDARVTERKAMRNITWFIKRLRPRYVRLILDMRRNSKLYNLNVKKYVSL